jgi:uncharacterized protein YecE (DUF72 family)
VRVLAGTSGFSYAEWKGPFYPEKLPGDRMLKYYSERLPAVEINNTFYRMPRPEMLAAWAGRVSTSFVFAIKAPQRITHRARLAGCAEDVERLWKVCQVLGPHLGPILFQLPPYFRKDAGRLRDFVTGLPHGLRAAFEFRHASWFDEEVDEILRSASAALCAADTDAGILPRLAATAPWGYLRLRREDYVPEDLAAWADRLRRLPWEDVFVFFKHEDGAAGPRMAMEFAARFVSGA